MKARWISGNRVSLLENGEAFFPRVFECIAAAQREVLLETFILFEDKVGRALHAALLTAARRGVRIDITVDGYGSPDLSPHFVGTLAKAGVRIHVFDPAPRLWGMRTNVFRRMHRKIVAIDAERAFVGGINYSADHLADYGPGAKQDYAVEIEGPLAQHIRGFAVRTLRASRPGAISQARNALSGKPMTDDLLDRYPALTEAPRRAGDMAAMLVVRDNRHHRNDIERQYRIAIRAARERVLIANAYFFPGYRLLRDMRRAARRGVDVQLILQGAPDMPIVKTAANLLYHHLLTGGVRIHEYIDRPLHGKVATSDNEWATVGSSNLDPLSLSLNLEANVIVRDRAFNAQLRERLDHLIAHSCRQVAAEDLAESSWWRVVRSFFVFHLLRRYPAWAGWLPAHAPQLTPAEKLVKAGAEPMAEADAS
jgi:cardiolipin synthase